MLVRHIYAELISAPAGENVRLADTAVCLARLAPKLSPSIPSQTGRSDSKLSNSAEQCVQPAHVVIDDPLLIQFAALDEAAKKLEYLCELMQHERSWI
jgi:hypothetical protein